MKHIRLVCLSLLLIAKAGGTMAQTQKDSTNVNRSAQRDACQSKSDSITWSKELDGVVVKAQKQLIKQEIDRIGYDVQADEESKTQTVMDMLRKVPMVTVDGQDNILVKGNSSYKIYKNGHYDPSLSKNAKETFKSMPASMVKRIEVITDPGAREDAEGVDAILNIVMVDGSKMQGMTGVVSASYNTNNQRNLYTSLTGQMGKLLASVDYGYGGMSSRSTVSITDTDRRYLDTGNRMQSHSDGTNPGAIHYSNLNASYDIDSLNLLSASFGGYFYKLNVQFQQSLLDARIQPFLVERTNGLRAQDAAEGRATHTLLHARPDPPTHGSGEYLYGPVECAIPLHRQSANRTRTLHRTHLSDRLAPSARQRASVRGRCQVYLS